MHAQSPVTVRVTRRFNVSPERLFDAWLNAELIPRFVFGDDELVRISIDPRPGGRFSFVVRRQGQELDHTGEYLELDRPRTLVFTWGVATADEPADTSRVRIDIAPLEAGAELTLSHEIPPRWADFASRTEAGWTKILTAMAAVLG
jgi:uncharacterized protein YndB with AHSA1/START domain